MRKGLILIAVIVFLTAIIPVKGLFANETHDGFYFNIQAGYAPYDTTTIEDFGGSDYELSGASSYSRISIGGAPVNNFIIYGVMGGTYQTDPDFDWGTISTSTEVTITYYDIGIGLAYYIMPINIYLSVAFEGTYSIWDDDGFSDDQSETGYMVALSIGKEWWVSENWGLGISILYSYGVMKLGSEIGSSATEDEELIHSYFGIAFSATYN